MSGQSPAVVLYSSDGTELTVPSGSIVPTGTRTVLISGRNPAGDALYIPAAVEGNLGIAIMSDGYYVQSAATVTASGSQIVALNYFGTQEIALIVNVGTVTGAGSIQYTIQELDPGDGVTVYGNSATTSVINSGNTPGVFTAVLNVTTSPSVKITWTVTGTFSATIYSTISTKSTPATQTINGTVAATQSGSWTVTANQGTPNTLSNAWPIEITDGYGNIQGSSVNPVWVQGSIMVANPSVGPTAAAPPADATYVGALVTTAMESGLTSGDMYPFNLTTTGLLRIDGAYPLATAVATAVDMMQTGGVVTTAAPTYTTATVNALSLTTSGLLRVDGTGGVFNNASVGATGAAPPADATYMGALVTTAAESGLTSGDMYPLNMTTTGQLRIDGVYPLATAVATAVDMDQVGGVVTTAAPTYTTATVNALSLTTAGLLRIDGVYPINATTPTTDVTFVGGAVTTSAPTYTTGQLSALSLDTSGNLRVTGFVTTNKSTTAAITSVTVTASAATTLLAANANRIFASVYNNTNKNMYIALGSVANATTNFSILLITGSYWEVPNDWTGSISEFSPSGASGNVLVTELSP
jgi:hypothetical protein